jgi:hypothetical protein
MARSSSEGGGEKGDAPSSEEENKRRCDFRRLSGSRVSHAYSEPKNTHKERTRKVSEWNVDTRFRRRRIRFDHDTVSRTMVMIILPTTLRVTRAAAAAVAVRVPAGRSVGLAAASSSSSSSFRPIGRRSWASTLVVMDDIEAMRARDGSSTTSYSTPETTRRIVSAAMQPRVSETGKDSEIHLLVIDPVRVPSQIPIGVTKVLHWKNDARTANKDAGKAAVAEAGSAVTGRAFASDVAAQATEHAFVSRADATHLLATFGRTSGAALAQVATNLNVKLHENVVEIKGRGTPRGGCRKNSLECYGIDSDFSRFPSTEKTRSLKPTRAW